VSRGYSVAQTARLVCALRWACSRLAEMLERWAAQAASAPEHAEAAARMSELSLRLASHREALDGLQPDSELMAPWRQAAPADESLVAALDEIAASGGSVERLDIARNVLVPELLGVYAEISEHAAPHCDGALISAASSLGFDLNRQAGPAGATQSGAVEATAGALSAAGGIVERSLLRPA
jgi:hypothetical protein